MFTDSFNMEEYPLCTIMCSVGTYVWCYLMFCTEHSRAVLAELTAHNAGPSQALGPTISPTVLVSGSVLRDLSCPVSSLLTRCHRGCPPGGREESDLTTMKLILTCHEGSSTFSTRNIPLDSTGQVTVLRSSPQQGRILSAQCFSLLSENTNTPWVS